MTKSANQKDNGLWWGDKYGSMTPQENITRLEEGSEEENCNLSQTLVYLALFSYTTPRTLIGMYI